MNATFEARAARLRTALAAHRQEFLEDQHWLASLPMFAPRSGHRDAGPLLGPRVRWMREPGDANPISMGGTLDRSVIGKLGDNWMHAGPELWGGVDFAWMAHLGEYDLYEKRAP